MISCILCANGNDLPEGEKCAGCEREGSPIQPARSVAGAVADEAAYIDLSDKDLSGLLTDLADLSTDEAVTEALFEANRRLALYAFPPSPPDREALEALSMWCTDERLKIRGRGGFDDQTEREIGIALVEGEIDRRSRAAVPPDAGSLK